MERECPACSPNLTISACNRRIKECRWAIETMKEVVSICDTVKTARILCYRVRKLVTHGHCKFVPANMAADRLYQKIDIKYIARLRQLCAMIHSVFNAGDVTVVFVFVLTERGRAGRRKHT